MMVSTHCTHLHRYLHVVSELGSDTGKYTSSLCLLQAHSVSALRSDSLPGRPLSLFAALLFVVNLQISLFI